MSAYDDKIWLALYAAGQPAEITPEFENALDMFKASVDRNPDGDIIRYFDGRITFGELDQLTDAFAAGILDAGFAIGERVAIYAQNVPRLTP
jgi:long-chain acyl-CoA synthetase